MNVKYIVLTAWHGVYYKQSQSNSWGAPIGLNKDTFMCLDAYKNKTIYKSQVKLDHFK